MICISIVKIWTRPWGGICEQMICLMFGKVMVWLFCREYKRQTDKVNSLRNLIWFVTEADTFTFKS